MLTENEARLRELRQRWQNPPLNSAERHDPQGTLRAIRQLERAAASDAFCHVEKEPTI